MNKTDFTVNKTDFKEVAVVSRAKFQWPVAVVTERKNVPGLPEQAAGVPLTDRVVLIWGSGREDYLPQAPNKHHLFRRGYPFFAVVPLSQVEKMSHWRYFAGTNRSGQPQLVPGEQNATPLLPFGNERHAEPGQPPYHKCVGDFSVAYVAALKKWVMLYACGSTLSDGYNEGNVRGIHLRTADAPWGPWSEPRLIFDPEDIGHCYFMYHKSKCSPHKLPSNLGTGTWNPKDQERVERNAQKDPQKTAGGDWDLMFGGEYAPFLIPELHDSKGITIRKRDKPLLCHVHLEPVPSRAHENARAH